MDSPFVVRDIMLIVEVFLVSFADRCDIVGVVSRWCDVVGASCKYSIVSGTCRHDIDHATCKRSIDSSTRRHGIIGVIHRCSIDNGIHEHGIGCIMDWGRFLGMLLQI